MYCAFALSSEGYLLYSKFQTPAQIRTVVFFTLSVSDQLSVIILRARSFIFTSTRPGGWLALTVFCCALVTTICSVYWPFGSSLEPILWRDVMQSWLIVLLFTMFKDTAKVLMTFVVSQMFYGPNAYVPKLLLQKQQHQLQ